MTRTQKVAALVVVAGLAVVYAVNHAGSPEVCVAKDAVASRWSKDGQALYYAFTASDSLHRYNLSTGGRERISLAHGRDKYPYGYLRGFDVSPDRRQVVLLTEETGTHPKWVLTVVDLKTRKANRIARYADGRSTGVAWLSNNRIAYDNETTGEDGVSLISPDGSSRTRLRRHAGLVYHSADGSAFGWWDPREVWTIYQVPTGRFVEVRSPWHNDRPLEVVFLSSRRIMFRLVDSVGNIAHRTVDLRTGTASQVSLPGPGGIDISISPDGRHVRYTVPGTDFPSRLYVADVPPETAEALTR